MSKTTQQSALRDAERKLADLEKQLNSIAAKPVKERTNIDTIAAGFLTKEIQSTKQDIEYTRIESAQKYDTIPQIVPKPPSIVPTTAPKSHAETLNEITDDWYSDMPAAKPVLPKTAPPKFASEKPATFPAVKGDATLGEFDVPLTVKPSPEIADIIKGIDRSILEKRAKEKLAAQGEYGGDGELRRITEAWNDAAADFAVSATDEIAADWYGLEPSDKSNKPDGAMFTATNAGNDMVVDNIAADFLADILPQKDEISLANADEMVYNTGEDAAMLEDWFGDDGVPAEFSGVVVASFGDVSRNTSGFDVRKVPLYLINARETISEATELLEQLRDIEEIEVLQ